MIDFSPTTVEMFHPLVSIFCQVSTFSTTFTLIYMFLTILSGVALFLFRISVNCHSHFYHHDTVHFCRCYLISHDGKSLSCSSDSVIVLNASHCVSPRGIEPLLTPLWCHAIRYIRVSQRRDMSS